MSIPQIITLLEFCLKNTYFLFQGKYYEQVHGAAMGSLISLLITKPLGLPHTPHLWLRFVDDTFVIQKAEHGQQLLHHINTQDPHIKFKMEEPDQDGLLPFLDTQVSSGPNNILTTTVYRKPTHTHHYLHWGSNHFIMAKHSAFKTLACRTKVVSTNQQTLHKELEHIRKALQACHFPSRTLNKLQHKFEHKHNINNGPNSRDNQPNNKNSGTNNNNISIVVPYTETRGKIQGDMQQQGYTSLLQRDQHYKKHSPWYPKTETTNFKSVG